MISVLKKFKWSWGTYINKHIQAKKKKWSENFQVCLKSVRIRKGKRDSV